jgi:hypothetical protein
MAVDYFSFLASEMPREATSYSLEWCPWSTLYLTRPPLFIRAAEHRKIELRLTSLFRISSLEEFRRRTALHTPNLERLFQSGLWASPLQPEDMNRIGTR